MSTCIYLPVLSKPLFLRDSYCPVPNDTPFHFLGCHSHHPIVSSCTLLLLPQTNHPAKQIQLSTFCMDLLLQQTLVPLLMILYKFTSTAPLFHHCFPSAHVLYSCFYLPAFLFGFQLIVILARIFFSISFLHVHRLHSMHYLHLSPLFFSQFPSLKTVSVSFPYKLAPLCSQPPPSTQFHFSIIKSRFEANPYHASLFCFSSLLNEEKNQGLTLFHHVFPILFRSSSILTDVNHTDYLQIK